jgi:hypothetical protein
MSEENLRTPTPTTQREERLDKLCDDFEAVWKAGGRPGIEEYLEAQESESSALLRELILLDVYYRRRVGEGKQVPRWRGPEEAVASLARSSSLWTDKQEKWAIRRRKSGDSSGRPGGTDR